MSRTDHTSDAPLNLAVERVVASGIDRVRSKLLALCSEIAPRLVGAKQADAEAMLMDAVHEALDELDAVAEAALSGDDPTNDPRPAA